MTSLVEPVDELTLREAAAQLDVHYMTAYRYVRNGRLPAHKVGAEWRVRAADLHLLSAPAPAPEPASAASAGSRPRRSRDPARLAARLVVGDEAGAWGVVEQAMSSGAAPADVLVQLVAPAMTEIGDRWELGEITIAQEHRASAAVLRIIGRIGPRLARRGRKRGSVVLGCVAGEHHAVPVAILSDLLRGESFEVTELGADTPIESFVEVVEAAQRLVAVGLSVTLSDALVSVPATILAIRAAAPHVAVVVGGIAVRDAAHAAELGADSWATGGESAVELFEGLSTSRRVRAS